MPVRWALLVLATTVLSACAASGTAEEAPRDQSSTGSAVKPIPTPTQHAGGEAAGPVLLEIKAGDLELIATLRDTEAARGLLAQLPLTLTMRDHGGVEKTGALPQALSVAGEPDGADPDVADLGYYAPSHDLVLYYGDQSYYAGIVILGRLQGDVRGLQEIDDLVLHVRRLSP